MSKIDVKFGHLLKSQRKKMDLSQDAVAEKVKTISRISIANYESGSQKVSLENAIRLAIALDFSLDAILKEVKAGSLDSSLERIPDEGLQSKLKEAWEKAKSLEDDQ